MARRLSASTATSLFLDLNRFGSAAVRKMLKDGGPSAEPSNGWRADRLELIMMIASAQTRATRERLSEDRGSRFQAAGKAQRSGKWIHCASRSRFLGTSSERRAPGTTARSAEPRQGRNVHLSNMLPSALFFEKKREKKILASPTSFHLLICAHRGISYSIPLLSTVEPSVLRRGVTEWQSTMCRCEERRAQ